MRNRILTVIALASGVVLAGCDGFDPMDKFQDLDIMATSKPKLTGERKAVFPTGVPGVPQGVPPDLVKGYQPPPEPAPLPVAEKPKPKPKKAVAVRRLPLQQAQEVPTRTAPVARTTTTTTEPPPGGMRQMPGSQPAWPEQAPQAPAAWPGPQR